jgi:hypothetical protein
VFCPFSSAKLEHLIVCDRSVRQDKHFSVTPVYLSSLKNPNTALQDQVRATVVLGQIERSGSIFEVVVDKKLPNDGTRFSQAVDTCYRRNFEFQRP